MPGVCPDCGIAYAKWLAAQQPTTPIPHFLAENSNSSPASQFIKETTLLQMIRGRLLDVPEQVNPIVLWGRVLVYIFFVIWGLWFIFSADDWVKIMGSFMHSINLPIHEFGHVLFRPFGRFMMILGGSLFQVMVPLIVMIVFLRQRDNFEASIMLGWAGQNFIDLYPYISDAQYRGLPLIMGMGEEGHDWGNLLTMLGTVENSYAYGKFSFTVGVIILICSFAWGAYILYKQKKNITAY
jgi:hypothetical protein